MKNALVLAAIAASVVLSEERRVNAQLSNVRSVDGSNNNPEHPLWGAARTRLVRAAPADYPGDGSGETIYVPPDAPNPRDVSNLIVVQSESIVNARGLSDFVWAWGQFVDHDIDLTVTSPLFGTADIPVHDSDDPLGPNPIPFDRSEFDLATGFPGVAREAINGVTAFIDASNVYGSDTTRASALRTFARGRLATSAGNLPPFNTAGLPNAELGDAEHFLAGDVRANEHVGLTALHTLFVREHNRLANLIARRNRRATDEEIYQLSRKIVGAEIQNITYKEFLPALLGPYAPSLEEYAGWVPDVDPSIVTEFSTAFYRFGHSMLSPNLQLAGNGGASGVLPLRDAFFNPDFLANSPGNVERLLKGFSIQAAQEIDTRLVDDVRSFLFGPPGDGGLDLASLNIQRGRDHGLPDYNALRAAYGLLPVADFDEISSDPSVQVALELLYGDVDTIDPWIGGLAEDHLPGGSAGELVTAALVDQFTRLRDGDRFFFLNDQELRSPLVRSVIDLDRLTLARVIRANTDIQSISDDVFFAAPADAADVTAEYDESGNLLIIEGTARADSILMIGTPFGLMVLGTGDTRINGQRFQRFSVSGPVHLSVDMRAGNDTLTLVDCEMSSVDVLLGHGDDTLRLIGCDADSVQVDGGDGTDAFSKRASRIGSGTTVNVP